MKTKVKSQAPPLEPNFVAGEETQAHIDTTDGYETGRRIPTRDQQETSFHRKQ
jgi:hypothetical protein